VKLHLSPPVAEGTPAELAEFVKLTNGVTYEVSNRTGPEVPSAPPSPPPDPWVDSAPLTDLPTPSPIDQRQVRQDAAYEAITQLVPTLKPKRPRRAKKVRRVSKKKRAKPGPKPKKARKVPVVEFVCGVCKRSFSTARGRTHHVTTEHGKQRTATAAPHPTPPPAPPAPVETVSEETDQIADRGARYLAWKEQGKTLAWIQEKEGVSQPTVSKYLKKAREARAAGQATPPPKLGKAALEAEILKRAALGRPHMQIARDLGVAHTAVELVLRHSRVAAPTATPASDDATLETLQFHFGGRTMGYIVAHLRGKAQPNTIRTWIANAYKVLDITPDGGAGPDPKAAALFFELSEADRARFARRVETFAPA